MIAYKASNINQWIIATVQMILIQIAECLEQELQESAIFI